MSQDSRSSRASTLSHAESIPICTAAASDHAPVRRLRHAEESNRRYRYLLSQGITGLSVAFDLPTQMVSIPTSLARRSRRVGVAICSLADMERLLDGIRLDQITRR